MELLSESFLLSAGGFFDPILKVLKSELFWIFAILIVGYLIGRITVKGVSLGSSGVFIIALAAGCLIAEFGESWGIATGQITSIIKNLGLVLFVAAVGFIAGPVFFKNFKNKAVAYIVLGITIIVSGTLVCILCIALDPNLSAAEGAGLLMGALTSTPGLSSAQNVFEAERASVAAASGLSYPFGVLGVVLFVQLVPKILKADMDKEVEKMRASAGIAVEGASDVAEVGSSAEQVPVQEASGENDNKKPLITMDSYGLCVFSLAVLLGLLVGGITIPLGAGASFSLAATGGTLLVGLLFGHFKKAGRVSLTVPKSTLNVFRELGLVLFLVGSGLEGGSKFLEVVTVSKFFYGVAMTLIPMIIGFFIAKKFFKLELLNNLGAICGGMTSTPALGSLIGVAKTDDVAAAYAATYPVALLLLVFVPQIISLIF